MAEQKKKSGQNDQLIAVIFIKHHLVRYNLKIQEKDSPDQTEKSAKLHRILM